MVDRKRLFGMLVAQIQENYSIGLLEAPIPRLPERGALVRLQGCGLCGSDLDKLIHQKAQPGSVLGHEVVGVIEALAENAPMAWQVGDRLVTAHHVPCLKCHYCLNDSESMCRQFKNSNLFPGGFSEVISLTAEHLMHTAFKVPDSITDQEASCVEPLACILRAIRRAGKQHSSTILIVGLGFIGMTAAQVYRRQGYTVFGVDLDRTRNALAKQHDFVTDAFHPTEAFEALQSALEAQSPLGKVDTAFLTVVNRQTVEQSLLLLRDGGNLVTFTSAAKETWIDPSQLYFREINLITSYSPALEDLRQAAELIFTRKINVLPLISHELPLQEIRQAFELYRSGKAIKVFISTGTPS